MQSSPTDRTRPASAAILALAAFLALAAALPASDARAGETALNIFGLSRHFKESADGPMREFNPGAGLQWTFARSRRGSLETNVGVYRDSFDHANWHWSLGGRWRVAGPLAVGVQAINSVSASFSDGYPTVTPYPFAALSLRGVTMNVAYLPEIGTINGVPSVATYFTVRPWARGGADDDDRIGNGATDGAGTALEFDVNGLLSFDGFAYNGISWQQRFDRRHGLRLGVQLWGRLETSDGPGLSAWGDYEASLLAQYLRRLEPRARVTPYWATGLETRYLARNSLDEVEQYWRTDLGAAYRLDDHLSLTFEYGLRAGIAHRAFTSDGWTDSQSRWKFADATARLALVIERATAPTGAATRLPGGGRSLAFAASGTLRLNGLRGYSIAWRTLDGPARAWRFVLNPAFGGDRDEDFDGEYIARNKQLGMGLRAERHFRRAADERLVTYWGVGPVVLVDYREWENVQPDGEGVRTLRTFERNFRIGATALVGAEYMFVADLYALLEWSTDLTWQYHAYDPGTTYRSVSMDSGGTRLGIGVPF